MSDIMVKDKWISELAQEYKSAEEIPVQGIAQLAEYLGIEVAIKCYNFFNGTPQYFSDKNMMEMRREYVRKCFNDQKTEEVARKLSLTKRTIENFLNEPMPKKENSLKIEMFPEYGRSKI